MKVQSGVSLDRIDASALIAQWFLRLAMAAGFLSAVADRFGLWGAKGAPGVAWGDWNAFLAYSNKLNGFMPAPLHEPLAWAATAAEVLIAIGLLIGWKLKWFALAAGVLTLLFAVSMTVALGAKSPLDYSVWTFSAAGFYLAFSVKNKPGKPHRQAP